MTDSIMTLSIAGVEALLAPAIYGWLKMNIDRKWIRILLFVLIVIVMTIAVGTSVSVLSYLYFM